MTREKYSSKKILTVIAALILTVIFALSFFASAQTADAATLSDSDLPEALRSYDFWYFGSGNPYTIDMQAVKTAVSSWGLSGTADDPVLIGVIDTGINSSHPLFQKVLYKPVKIAESDGTPIPEEEQTAVTVGYNVNGTSTAFEDTSSDRHGTHVAGIIATMILELGLEDYIKIVPIRAVNASGTFNQTSIVSAIEWACGDNNAETTLGKPLDCDVINMSFGILDSNVTNTSWSNRAALESALDEHSSTTVFVASAGNDSSDLNDDPFYPAAMENVVSVMSYNEEHTLYDSSNYGAYDLIAPGENVYSASSGSSYVLKNGTSMASPFVALGAALVRLRYDQTAQQTALGFDPNGRQISKMLRTHSENYVELPAYDNKLKVFDLEILATANFADAKYDVSYSDPTKIDISVSEGAKLTQYANERTDINFTSSISPAGEYNPEFDNSVKWWIETVNADSSTNSFEASTGKDFSFPLEISGGSYNVYAVLQYQDKTFTSNKIAVSIRFVIPDFEKIKIAPAEESGTYNGNGSDVPSYIGYTNLLTLTDINFVDQNVEIKWYVDGVLSGTGTIFHFTPTETGNHVITAEFDGHFVYYTFTLTTKNPPVDYLVDTAVALAAGAAVFTLILLETRKRVYSVGGKLDCAYVEKCEKLFFALNKAAENKRFEKHAKNKVKTDEQKTASEPEADAAQSSVKKVEKCPKCGAYVKFSGDSGKCKYCGTEVGKKTK